MRPMFIALVIVAGALAGPEVLFETDFLELPEGWTNDPGWVFGTFGAALCESIDDSTWAGEFSSEGTPAISYAVPEGTDSVRVVVDQWVFLSSGETASRASSTAMVQLWTNHSGWGDHIYYKSISDSLFTETVTTTYTMTDIQPNTSLGFRFRGEIEAGPGNYAEVIWQVTRMTVTAYGPALSLEATTWGRIKSGLM